MKKIFLLLFLISLVINLIQAKKISDLNRLYMMTEENKEYIRGIANQCGEKLNKINKGY